MSVIKKIGRSARKKKKPIRKDWEWNHEQISNAFWSIATYSPTNLKMPKYEEISKKTGVCVKTVERHVRMMDLQRHMQKLRCVEDKMLIIFMNRVSKCSNDKMWELYFNLTNPTFNKKQVIDVTTNGKEIIPNAITSASIEQLEALISKAADSTPGKD